ncbi:IclR family transcriptional regulator domain-containing protein [Advenella kashmirensis]|uniref:IclR family transcriptional regulator domain-containing protein n=1 Tax=Advenella kashmirensis TaxID=310575 RepID=UPI001EE63A7D|nr:IclR family transcriptional regulator C-terminal domain-containing protein [Advenella kashmirensis]
MRTISEKTGDSSFLIRQDNADSLCIHREIGTYPLQVLSIQIDHKQPMGVGAAGLALLSYLPESEQERILAENEHKLYPYGAITVKKLRLLMTATRERGWSAVGNAAVQGVLGVGVAIADRRGCPRFAISVSSVEARFTVKRQKAVVQIIKDEIAALDSYGCIK